MSVGAAISSEATSLHEEATRSCRDRRAPNEDRSSPNVGAGQKQETSAQQKLQDELNEFAKVVTEFVADAEKNLSQHPAATVFGSLLIGILIGRLIGRH
jgi:ElaB/YqjD/DUF883 family membrane-anchored ribosome-binding protein